MTKLYEEDSSDEVEQAPKKRVYKKSTDKAEKSKPAKEKKEEKAPKKTEKKAEKKAEKKSDKKVEKKSDKKEKKTEKKPEKKTEKKRKRASSDTEESESEDEEKTPNTSEKKPKDSDKKKKRKKVAHVDTGHYVQEFLALQEVKDEVLKGNLKHLQFHDEATNMLSHIGVTYINKLIQVAETLSTISRLKSIKEDKVSDAIDEVLGGSKKELNHKMMKNIHENSETALAAYDSAIGKSEKKTSSKKK